jgi:neutral ceramidase
MTSPKKIIATLLCCLAFACQFDEKNSGGADDPAAFLNAPPPEEMPFLIGAGSQDITGPAAEVMFAGYCDFNQTGSGIYMRQRARTFIIKDRRNGKGIVMVSAEIPLMSSGIYVDVIKKLRKSYGARYTEKNVVISATHTHSGPGGYFRTYALNIFAGMTFHQKNYDTIVEGICDSIAMAHESLAPGRILYNRGEFSPERFKRLSRQRSPEAYTLNRDIDDYLLPDGSHDDANREMLQLKFVRFDEKTIGMYNWAPIHPNVSGSHLRLINGDINGHASYLIEQAMGADYASGEGFVAVFAYNDAADTSSNLPEDAIVFNTDANPDNNVPYDGTEDYIADGPNDYARVAMRARTVTALAQTMFDQATVELTGAIDYRQVFAAAQAMPIDPQFIDDEDIYYARELDENKSRCRLCNGAAGVGFFAGSTEDGDSGMVNAGEGNPRDVTDYSASTLADLIADPVPAIVDLLLRTIVPGPKLYAEMDCQLEKRMTLNFDELNRLIPEEKPGT